MAQVRISGTSIRADSVETRWNGGNWIPTIGTEVWDDGHVTDLPVGTNLIEARAIRENFTSDIKHIYIVIPAVEGVPSAPVNPLASVSGVDEYGTTVDVTWGIPVSDGGVAVDSYYIYRGTELNVLGTLIGTATGTAYSDFIESSTEVVSYFYNIKAHNTVGLGTESIPAMSIGFNGRALFPLIAPVMGTGTYDDILNYVQSNGMDSETIFLVFAGTHIITETDGEMVFILLEYLYPAIQYASTESFIKTLPFEDFVELMDEAMGINEDTVIGYIENYPQADLVTGSGIIEDTFVDLSNPDNNYSTDEHLIAEFELQLESKMMMRLTVGTWVRNISNTTIHMKEYLESYSGYNAVDVYLVGTNILWNPTTVTWNTMPSTGSQQSSITMAGSGNWTTWSGSWPTPSDFGEWQALDIFVVAHYDGGSDNYLEIYSTHASDAGDRPYLVIDYYPPDPTYWNVLEPSIDYIDYKLSL